MCRTVVEVVCSRANVIRHGGRWDRRESRVGSIGITLPWSGNRGTRSSKLS